MRQTRQFQQHRQTRAQNRLAFKMWLNCATDDAVAAADPVSLSRSYGIPVEDVNKDVRLQTLARRIQP